MEALELSSGSAIWSNTSLADASSDCSRETMIAEKKFVLEERNEYCARNGQHNGLIQQSRYLDVLYIASLIYIPIVVFQFQIASAETNERKVHTNESESIHINVWTKPCRTHDPIIIKHYYRSVQYSTVVQEYSTALTSLLGTTRHETYGTRTALSSPFSSSSASWWHGIVLVALINSSFRTIL